MPTSPPLLQMDEDKTHYLIAWKGTDTDGKAWQPTWVGHPRFCPRPDFSPEFGGDVQEPKANANQPLVNSWTQKQRAARKSAKAAKAAEKKRKLEIKNSKQAKVEPVAAADKVPKSKTNVVRMFAFIVRGIRVLMQTTSRLRRDRQPHRPKEPAATW